MTTTLMSHRRKPTLIDSLFAETINYGGIAATRMQAYQHALDCGLSRLDPNEPNREQRARLGAEQFAFGRQARALSPDEAAQLVPWDTAVAAGALD